MRPAELHPRSAEKTARPRIFRHFVPSRALHSLATLVRLPFWIWPLRSHSTPPRSTPSPASMTTSLKRAFMSTLSAANRSLHPWTSIIPGVAGRRSPGRSRKMLSLRPWTLHMVWSGRKCAAAARIPIWVTCSTMVPASPAGCVIASTRQLLDSFPTMNWKNKGMGSIGSSLSKNNQKSIQGGI